MNSSYKVHSDIGAFFNSNLHSSVARALGERLKDPTFKLEGLLRFLDYHWE